MLFDFFCRRHINSRLGSHFGTACSGLGGNIFSHSSSNNAHRCGSLVTDPSPPRRSVSPSDRHRKQMDPEQDKVTPTKFCLCPGI